MSDFLEEMIVSSQRRADEAVYDAKRGGGDFAEVDD